MVQYPETTMFLFHNLLQEKWRRDLRLWYMVEPGQSSYSENETLDHAARQQRG